MAWQLFLNSAPVGRRTLGYYGGDAGLAFIPHAGQGKKASLLGTGFADF
jgi:hypothetical protein